MISYYSSYKIHEGPIYTIIIAVTSLHLVPNGSLNKFNCTYFTGIRIVATSTYTIWSPAVLYLECSVYIDLISPTCHFLTKDLSLSVVNDIPWKLVRTFFP